MLRYLCGFSFVINQSKCRRINSDLPSWLSLPSIKNISRYVNGFRNTACGHNDFCSVRLNGPIWSFILTHKYRLSLSQFTEAVLVESATGATFATQKQESPDAKVSCPFGYWRIIVIYRFYLNIHSRYSTHENQLSLLAEPSGC